MEKLILIDGNSLLNRAYYATPAFTNESGFPTNAIFGFIKLLLKIVSDKKPQYMAVAFDVHAPTFRHKEYAEYKAGRKPMPDDLAKQLPALKELLTLMNIKTVELAGYEADDLIGTLAKRFPVQTYIYTGDRDSYQLVDETTNVCYTKRGVSDLLELNIRNFKDEIGLIPSQIIDLKSLMGDSSDNIPGVNGIGEKSARDLLEKYSTLDGVYEHIDEIKGALREKLINGKESGYFSYKLATIDTLVPYPLELSECIFKEEFSPEVREKFIYYGFRSLLTLPIFSKESDATEEKKERIETVEIKSVEEGIKIVSEAQSEFVFVSLEKDRFSFYCAKKEYACSVKELLMDVGFFADELKPLLDAVFCSKKRVVAFDVKYTKHILSEVFSADFTASFDDVSIIKNLADGKAVSEKLGYYLDYEGISRSTPAYGVSILYQKYINKLTDEEEKLYREVELPLLPVLYDMEKTGVVVDEKMIDELSKRFSKEAKELSEKICGLAGETFNLNSPSQLSAVLFDKLKIDGNQNSKKKHSTSADVLEEYAENHEIVRLVLRYRTIQKLNSTYLDGYKQYIKAGKVHTTYNQTNTSTGRLSSENPNIQNIPVRTDEGRILRKIFKPCEGNVFVDADYSQIELRLLAHFSKSSELIKAYNEGRDIHTLTASQVFNTPIEEITETQRRNAKAVNFGIIYGISPYGLSKDIHVPAKKAKEYIDKYFETYGAVKEYMDGNVLFAKQNGYVKTLLGRKRVIDEINSSNHVASSFGERASMNMPLQGSSADIIKIAMINVYNRLKKENLKAKLVLQIHDELIIDCPKNEEETVKKLLKEEMEGAVSLNVPLSVDVGIGENWYEAH